MLTGCSALLAQAGFVSETSTELITTADLDGDGRADIVIADKPSGTFRVGYQMSADNFTWSESRSLGATNITGLATGSITDPSFDAIAACTPLLNRIHLIEATDLTQPSFPLPVFGKEVGPKTIISLEIGGGTSEQDLVVIHTLGTAANPNRLELTESYGSAFSFLHSSTIPDAWERGNSMVYHGTDVGGTFLDRANNTLELYEFSSGTPTYFDSFWFGTTALTSPDYCPVYPVAGDFVHIIAWDPGTPDAVRFRLEAGNTFSPSTPLNFGGDIRMINTVSDNQFDWLLVSYMDGSASIFDFEGKHAYDLSPTAGGLNYSSAMQTGDERFMLLTADQQTGTSLLAELFEHDGSKFVGTGAYALPEVSFRRGRANVFTFENEPFIDPNPRRLQALSAGDWSTGGGFNTGPLRIVAKFETDQGLPEGLGNTDAADLGYAHIDAQHILVNQAGDAYSVYSKEAAFGYQEAEAFVNPAPGHYRTGIAVSFTNSTGEDIYYRLTDSLTWTKYTNPIPLFKEESILFYAEAASGNRSPIQTAAYSFEDDPATLDSDGDTVPDYVELAHGLDPLEGGLDEDGDGYSDLEELLAGSNPNSSNSVPVLPIPGTSGRLEQLSAFDLHITPRPYDGVQNAASLCETGTALRAFSGTGWHYGYGVSTNHGAAGITDPSVLITNMPSAIEAGFFTLLTDQHFITTADNLAIEMAGILTPPLFQSLEIPEVYNGGDLSSEAAAWTAAAQLAVANLTAPVLTDDLTTDDVLAAMLVERKLMDELYDAESITNRYATLFPGREADKTMLSASSADFSNLRNSTNAAFLPETVLSEIGLYMTIPDSASLRNLTEQLYDICCDRTDSEPGAYPLPISILRAYLLDGTMNANYAAHLSFSGSELAQIQTAATNFLNTLSARPIENLVLEVRENSFTNICPVLYTAGGIAKSLYDSGGRPYVMPFSFKLGAGAEVTARAFNDISWNRVPGTDPLEIISLSLTAVPVSSDSDANGNLLPDALEELLQISQGSPAHLDSDGDGFSDLQEYLDGSDPSDPLSEPTGSIVDLSPPEVVITSLGGNQVQLSVQWPVAYADPFIFSVIRSDDLSGSGFSSDHELAPGELSSTVTTTSSDARFYKVGIQLR